MAVETATFAGLAFGSSYDTSSGNFTASASYASSDIDGFLSDSGSTNGYISVGDGVSYNYNFAGSSYNFEGVFEGYFDSGGTQYPLVLNSGTYYLLGQTSSTTYPITSASDTQVVCFCAGTLIRTVRGDVIADVAVEDLAIGDLAVTASGTHRPVRWLGSRTLDCRNHPRPHEAMPVRIRAHALGATRPARDLLVSPGHAICVDVLGEVLIPASALVNGSTIIREDVDDVTYWHVELDGHDILIAENLPAESYLEMGNRSFFAENDVVGLAGAPDVAASARTHADFCRPFYDGGPLVDVVRAQLRIRATALGWALDHSDPLAGLHLMVDGTRVEPVTRGLSTRFAVPAGAEDVWLVSAAGRPCDVTAIDDARELGVFVYGLIIDDGFAPPRALDLADPLLGVGFHDLEDDARRWTAGRAKLPAALWSDHENADGFFLRVDLALPGLPRWVAPVAQDLAVRAPALAATPRLSLLASA